MKCSVYIFVTKRVCLIFAQLTTYLHMHAKNLLKQMIQNIYGVLKDVSNFSAVRSFKSFNPT